MTQQPTDSRIQQMLAEERQRLEASVSTAAAGFYGHDQWMVNQANALARIVTDQVMPQIESLVTQLAFYLDAGDEEAPLRDMMADLLTRTANVVKGAPAQSSQHSWHDLPEATQARLDSLSQAATAAHQTGRSAGRSAVAELVLRAYKANTVKDLPPALRSVLEATP